jgi:hypothetical protein
MNPVLPGVLLIRAAAVLVLIAPLAASSSERADCTALVSIGADLFGVSASRPMLRYTRDGAKRDSATISPDASFVIFNTHDSEIGRSHAHAALASGGAFDLEVPNRLETKNFLERMDAHGADAIAVRYSGHNFYRFEWLSSHGELLNVPLTLGSDCALSRSGRVACIEGNGVTLDGGHSWVFDVDPFEKIPVIDVFPLGPGSSHAIAGLGGVAVTGGKFNTNGLWVEISGENGGLGSFNLAFDDVYVFPIMLADEGAIWLRASAPREGRITVEAKYREGDILELDPVIAIDDRASRIAIVRSSEDYRAVIMLKPTRGTSWQPDTTVRIDREPTVRRAYFADAATLYIAGDHAFGLVDLRRRTFERLPPSVVVEGPDGRTEVSVFDWACAAH